MNDMKLSFEKSRPGRRCSAPPSADVPPGYAASLLPAGALRARPPRLPEMAEVDVVRHYTALSRRSFGVDNGFYPLGSCTMKYNPRLNEELVALPGFTDIHPLAGDAASQGCLALMHGLSGALCEITGMDAFTLAPAAGAHGEWTGLLMIRAWHESRGDAARTTILVPDSAHGTNPASAALAGYRVQPVPSAPDGGVDIDALRRLAGPDTAGLMLTNPNTLGLFERRIGDIAAIVHGAGGLLYYDGANLNAIMSLVRPGDMGFDVVHINLHKTFGTPHGGGGPGSGPVGCRAHLTDYLPGPVVRKEGDAYSLAEPPRSIGRVTGFYGNFAVLVKAYAYILSLGADGLREASECAVLHANYMMNALRGVLELPYEGPCMHEFVLSARALREQTGCSALDISKAMLDHGMHPPTMYFPLIVAEALMIEPTETESPETLNDAIRVISRIVETARRDPAALHEAPRTTPVGRLNEVEAARHPVVRYSFGGGD